MHFGANRCEIEFYRLYEKVRRDFTPFRGDNKLRLYAARGETESFQLRIRAEKDTELESVQFMTCDGIYGEVFLLYFHKTAFQSTKFYATGEYPDAMFSWEDGKRIGLTKCPSGKNVVLLFRFTAGRDCEAKLYPVKIVLHFVGGYRAELQLAVEVNDLQIPEENHSRTAFGIWEEMLADTEGRCDDEIIGKYYDKLVEYRVSPTQLPYVQSKSENNDAFLHYAKIKTADKKVSTYTIPFQSVEKRDDRENAYSDLDEDALRILLAKMVRESTNETNLFQKAVLYVSIIDEPGEDRFELVKRICDAIEAIKKDVAETENFTNKEDVRQALLRLYNIVTVFQWPQLYGHVRCFCPLFSIYSMPEYVRESKRFQKLGGHVWWYGCIAPMHPHPNYHLDDNLQNIRAVPYLQMKYGTEGNLYWGVNVHKFYDAAQKKYVETDIYEKPTAYPGCNGDGFLLYPMKPFALSQPVPSLRLEMIRKANEDYEYLWLMEQEFNRLKKQYKLNAEFSEYLARLCDTIAFRTAVRETYIDFDAVKREICKLIFIAKHYNALFFVGERDAVNDTAELTLYCDAQTFCSGKEDDFGGYKIYRKRVRAARSYAVTLSKDGKKTRVSRLGHSPYRSLYIGAKKIFLKKDFDNAADTAEIRLKCRFDFSLAEYFVYEAKNFGEYAKTVAVALEDGVGNRFDIGYDVAEASERKTFRLWANPKYVTERYDYNSTAFCNRLTECEDRYKRFDFSDVRYVIFSVKNIRYWPYKVEQEEKGEAEIVIRSFGYEEK